MAHSIRSRNFADLCPRSFQPPQGVCLAWLDGSSRRESVDPGDGVPGERPGDTHPRGCRTIAVPGSRPESGPGRRITRAIAQPASDRAVTICLAVSAGRRTGACGAGSESK